MAFASGVIARFDIRFITPYDLFKGLIDLESKIKPPFLSLFFQEGPNRFIEIAAKPFGHLFHSIAPGKPVNLHGSDNIAC